MRLRFWRLPLLGRSAARLLVTGAAVLVLVVGLLTTTFFFRPTLAHADGNSRLDTFFIVNTSSMPYGVYHLWSDDIGATWSGPEYLGRPASNSYFLTSLSAVSDAPGRLELFAVAGPLDGVLFDSNGDDLRQANSSAIYSDVFNNGHWSGWFPWSGQTVLGYLLSSAPATTSWGPGRMELFINGYNQSNGAIALLHTWADNGVWSGKWEVLGTGLMQGHPAATSSGSGRDDVFVRGGGNELDHKWFANGHWSSGWENLGGDLAYSPTAGSGGDGWDVYALNPAGGLSTLDYRSWGYWGWFDLDSNTISASPAVAWTPGVLHVFARSPGGTSLLYKTWNQWWSGWSGLFSVTDPYGAISEPTAIVWDSIMSSTPPPPPPPRCGGPGQPPCPVTP